MPAWIWIVLGLAVLALLQLWVYRRAMHQGQRGGESNQAPSAFTGVEPPISDREEDDDPEYVICPACGTENEAGYAYCYNCVRQLPR
ncbi:MAG: zinc ribbon domain-containing protein [Halobacterium sp.]